MSKLIDLTGQRFGRLTVIERAKNNNNRDSCWCCRCDCGQEKIANGALLRKGSIQSCGCLIRDTNMLYKTTHGQTKTRLYRIWRCVKNRTTNPNDQAFARYGGRGITMCGEWKDSFTAFRDWSINNGYRDDLTIDRIDVNGNYEPSNCRWVDMKAQQNNRSNNHRLTYNGQTDTIAQWAKRTGISRSTLFHRINRLGWSVEDALSIPVGGKHKTK